MRPSEFTSDTNIIALVTLTKDTYIKGGYKLGCQLQFTSVNQHEADRNLSSISQCGDCVEKQSPLQGIRVLDLTRVLAGPFCTMLLGDLGAEIIKIEHPKKGDDTRHWGPPFIGKESCYFLSINRNKKSVTVNIKSPEGLRLIESLTEKSDVLIENFIPGKLNALGLGYDKLSTLNEQLIYCSITGFGSTGPYSQRGGYDIIAASIAGLLHITGPPDGAPCKVGVAMTDLTTGLYMYGAIIAALLQRQLTGKGQKIEANLLASQISCLANLASNYLNAGISAKRWGTAHESLVPYQAFLTCSGMYLTVGAGNDNQFKSLCDRLGIPHLVDLEEFKTNSLRVKNRQKLIEILEQKFLERTAAEWLEVFEGCGFPYGPVNSVAEAFKDPQVEHLDLVKSIKHTSSGDVKLVGPAVRFSGSRCEIHTPPPTLGQHTRQVLNMILGISDQKIDEFERKGIKKSLHLTLKQPKVQTKKKVEWTTDTVDNEHMGKKSSKCCCVYVKPRAFDDSDTEDEDDCVHCRGHVEVKKKHDIQKSGDKDGDPVGKGERNGHHRDHNGMAEILHETFDSVLASQSDDVPDMTDGTKACIEDIVTIEDEISIYGELSHFDFMLHKTGPEAGKPRGFCFASYATPEEASKAKQQLNGTFLMGRRIMVDWANEKSQGKSSGLQAALDIPALAGVKRSSRPSHQAQIAALEAKLEALKKTPLEFNVMGSSSRTLKTKLTDARKNTHRGMPYMRK
ncbi:unnamed protein product [Darwinula stevensoni]|uniref:RRM domain-containing protein n=1 Tax=Darwinula stevensoni TaxID=69355 RepID=A0A7R9A0R6_9CRUS|nr:unnamed protein product [Darwinula stevensoni]CAG0885107.1 unnamed protein product [Darwinula stevensoni]